MGNHGCMGEDGKNILVVVEDGKSWLTVVEYGKS